MSNEGTSAEHLPINMAQEYRVKLGKSFTFPEENSFHTLKCKDCVYCESLCRATYIFWLVFRDIQCMLSELEIRIAY